MNIWRVAAPLKCSCNNYVFAISYEGLFENKFQGKFHLIETTCHNFSQEGNSQETIDFYQKTAMSKMHNVEKFGNFYKIF